MSTTPLSLLRDIVAGVIQEQSRVDSELEQHVIGQNWKLEKAWHNADDVTFEGWMSTPDLDLEKMIVEPEAFMDSLEDYFARRAPLSYIHNERSLPAGHLQKAAIIRDGNVLKTASHPTDPAEFELPPESGSGVYVRGVVTEQAPAQAIRKGNVGAMSWIGYGKEYEPMPGGVRRFTKVTPLIESTVAPYPVNTKAVIRLAKAFGLEETKTMATLEEMLQTLTQQLSANEKLEKGLSEDAVKNIVSAALAEQAAQYETKLTKAVADAVAETEEKLTKAFDRSGTGRVAPTPAEERESDPAAYLLKKAKSGDELSPEDKALVTGLFKHVIGQGLKGSDK
jgi:hypothetical protein